MLLRVDRIKIYQVLLIILLLCIFNDYCSGKKAEKRKCNKNSTLSQKDREGLYKKYKNQAAESLLNKKFHKTIKLAKKALKYRPKDYLMRALICLCYYELGEHLDVQDDKQREQREELYDKMLDMAEQGIEYAPNKGECYFMRGLARARIATTSGVLYNLFKARSIEKDWLKALELGSEYITPTGEDLKASCNLALGAYYRLCPSFFMLKLIFGISGDLNKSVYYCRRAYKADPSRIEIIKELGVSLITRGLDEESEKDIEEGRKYLRMVNKLPLKLATDTVDKEHAEMLLDNMELCPGYSRDQQQDLSEESYNQIHDKD